MVGIFVGVLADGNADGENGRLHVVFPQHRERVLVVAQIAVVKRENDGFLSQGIELTCTTQPGVNAVVQGLPQTLYSMHRITMTEDTNMDEFLAELAK